MAATASLTDESAEVEWGAPCVATGSRHLPVVGYLRGAGPAGLLCDQPLSVVCGGVRRATSKRPRRVLAGCGARTVWACSCHRSSKCAQCAARYQRRVSRIAEYGLQLRSGRGFAYFLTVTAPGDRVHHKPSGEVCECTLVGGVELGTWNASCGRYWNRLRTAMKKAHPGLDFLGTVEVQKRGALHRHVLVWSWDALGLEEIRAMAVRAGFGHEVTLDSAGSDPGRFARYVAKYVSKAVDARAELPWRSPVVDTETGEIRVMHTTPTYRAVTQSRGWGITMREVKLVARIAACAAAERLRGQSPDEADPWAEPDLATEPEPPE